MDGSGLILQCLFVLSYRHFGIIRRARVSLMLSSDPRVHWKDVSFRETEACCTREQAPKG